MKIKYLTLTGADDSTSIENMLSLSQEFPHAEWAILFSQSKSGVTRYPSWDWVLKLLDEVSRCNFPVNLSAHLCGKWVDDVMNGKLTFLDKDTQAFGRFQLNLSKSRLWEVFSSKVWECNFEKPVIFGGPYSKLGLDKVPWEKYVQHKVSPLFDSSGGRGVLESNWPVPPEGIFCGYSGGLGPDNLQEQFEKISEVIKQNPMAQSLIWLDQETKLRTNDNFSLEKCREVLEISSRWI